MCKIIVFVITTLIAISVFFSLLFTFRFCAVYSTFDLAGMQVYHSSIINNLTFLKVIFRAESPQSSCTNFL